MDSRYFVHVFPIYFQYFLWTIEEIVSFFQWFYKIVNGRYGIFFNGFSILFMDDRGYFLMFFNSFALFSMNEIGCLFTIFQSFFNLSLDPGFVSLSRNIDIF
jgi:hypothetical protein